MYTYLDLVKQGLLTVCRLIIVVDGCHLKGDHGQQLLIVVGRDPNNNYCPIAVAIMEAETKDSWEWFLDSLMDNISKSKRPIFMSDKQKVRVI
ncbi:hypothetical protein AHAS_Ahas13G0439700 [Arachis hypogaea]